MNLLFTLFLALASTLTPQLPDEALSDAALPESAPGDEQPLPYGDLVLSEEEARLDLRAEPRLVWALLGEELVDLNLEALVVEAPVDRWQLIDELWLRVEALPYLNPGWTRVRVRAGSFETEADRQRAEDLLTAVAIRLLALEDLKQEPADAAAATADPMANLAPAASAGGGAFADQSWGPAAPLWIPVFGIGSVSCAAPLAFADTYAWAFGYDDYWPTYVSSYYGSGYGYGYGYSYGALGHYRHYSSDYYHGFHHGFVHGLHHGLYYDPWWSYDDHHDDVVIVLDDDDVEEWDGWENGGDAGEDRVVPDPDQDDRIALARRRALADAADTSRREPEVTSERRSPSESPSDERVAARREITAGVIPVVRREVERRNPTRGVSVMPESAVPSRAPIVVRRTSDRTGQPPTLRSSSLVDRVVRRSAPQPASPLVVGRPSLLPPTYGGGARTISASGVTRGGVPVSSASSVVSRSLAPSTTASRSGSTSSLSSRVSSSLPSRSRSTSRASVPTPRPSAPTISTSSRSTPSTAASRLFNSGVRGGSSRGLSSRSSSSRASSTPSRSSGRSTSSRSSGRSSSRSSSASRGSRSSTGSTGRRGSSRP